MQNPLIFCLVLLPIIAFSQNNRTEQQAKYAIKISRASSPIKIDGDIEEPAWQNAGEAGNFWMKWPRDGGPAPQQTTVKCAYDDKFLYVAAICYDSTPHNVVQSLKRDVGYWDSDGFSMVLDPINTANNGYFFGVNSEGVQSEGLLAVGVEDPDFNWDNTWLSKAKTYSDRWTVEFAIPLRILRYRAGHSTWGVNFIRNDLGNGIYSIWAQVPFQFDGLDLGWTGAMSWDEPPAKVKGNYNLIPYASTSISKDYEENEDWKIKPNAGMDAKISIGAGMNLDVTLHPDFSQVEIDQQVVNLTRFDVQLPEKRTFFLENGDLFGNFGIPPLRPFFSRRIGLDKDGNPLPILGGLRLSGNLNQKTRVGVMTMQTGQKDSIPSSNNTAVVVKRTVFGRSTVGAYFLNHKDFNKGELQKDPFSRNVGLEFNFISNDGKWNSWAAHHRSIKPDISGKNWWSSVGFAYNVRQFSFITDFDHVGENFYVDLGFEQRVENYDALRDTTFRIPYNYIFNEATLKFFPKKKNGNVNFSELKGTSFLVLNDDGSVNEYSPEIRYLVNFKSTSELKIGVRPLFANVPVSFKIDDEENLELCPPLPAAKYHFNQVFWGWGSDYRKAYFWGLNGVVGQYYNGTQFTFGAQFSYRFQPFVNLKLEAEYNKLNFPLPYCSVEYVNITPHVEVFFAKNLWWTTFLQYNTQSDNFNVNSRLQWRYRPMSDVFLVYTDNYAVKFWGPKNKALVLKVTYWL